MIDTLLVSLELQNERLDILAAILPLSNGLLSVVVEVLFLLIQQSLSVGLGLQLFSKLVFHSLLLQIKLVALVGFEFRSSLPFFLLLLLLSNGEFLVPDFPEGCKLFVLLDL